MPIKYVRKKKCGHAILTDLSKAFDCIIHELLIAKLGAYCFDESALGFIRSYVKETKPRTKVGNAFCLWREVLFVVPQGSILFNIFLNDIFFFAAASDIANYEDDNTNYVFADDLLNTLQRETNVLLKWFKKMK